jgi:hypothetical protein
VSRPVRMCRLDTGGPRMGPVQSRLERDGCFRYYFRAGTQMIVSRGTFPDSAEAIRAGETMQQVIRSRTAGQS